MTTTIADAKRLIAATSAEGLRILGAGVARTCSQDRYNAAARAALEDRDATLTPDERRFIASFIAAGLGPAADTEPRSEVVRLRITRLERERLEELAAGVGLSLSEYIRRRVFTD